MFLDKLYATAFMRNLLKDANAAAARATLDVSQNVGTSVSGNFVSFSNATGGHQDSGKGLSHLVYTIQTSGVAAINPADNSTYYFGIENAATTGANIRNVPFPFSGTIVYANVVIIAAAAGTAETFSCYLRINHATDVLVSNAASITGLLQKFPNSALSTAITADDYFEGKVVFPTWTTNPTGVKVHFVLGIQV